MKSIWQCHYKVIDLTQQRLSDRKHFLSIHQVIETRVEVGEGEMLREHEPWPEVPTASWRLFSISFKTHLHNSVYS